MAEPTLIKPLTDDQKQIIHILEEAVKEAKAGRIHTLGIVACMDKGPAILMGGTRAAELNIGLDKLKRAVLDATDRVPRPSPIVKANMVQ